MTVPAPNMTCIACGAPVLSGYAPGRGYMMLDVYRPAYAVHWPEGETEARLVKVDGYGEHICLHHSAEDMPFWGDLAQWEEP